MKKKIIISFIIITIISLLLTITNSFAKYISNYSWSYGIKGKEFYFDSDILENENNEVTNNFWDEQEISFDLKNYSNNNLISDMDISYKVSCEIIGDLSESLSCKINNTSNSVTDSLKSSGVCLNSTDDGVDTSKYTYEECITKNYEWKANKANKTYTLQVINTNNLEYSDVKVLVKAISSSPYSKTLEATYNLHKNSEKNIVSEYEAYSDYGRLSINNPSSKIVCVKAMWNSEEQLIDNKDINVVSSSVSSDGYINQIIFKINSNSSKNFLFFNRTTKEKTINDFTIEQLSDC